MVTRRDYTAEAVEAARSVLIELVHLLGEYKDDMLLVGGWIPEVSLPHHSGPHVGSRDVEIALNHLKIRDEGYRMIQDLLRSRGYQQGEQPFVFFRTVRIGDHTVKVQVDLLAGEICTEMQFSKQTDRLISSYRHYLVKIGNHPFSQHTLRID